VALSFVVTCVPAFACTNFMSQFDEVVHTDLSEELAKGSHVVRLTDLFPDELTERSSAQPLIGSAASF